MVSYRSKDVFGKHMGKTIKELIRKQEELKKSKERYRIVAEATKDIIWEGDLINRKRFFSGKLYETLGYNPEELEDFDKWFNIVHPDDLGLVKKMIKKQVGEKIEVIVFEYRVKAKNGCYKWVSSNTKCEFNSKGEAVATFGAFTDITELKEHQKRIHDLAYYDSVTGLPNRVMLSQVITEKIEKSYENNSKFSMIFIDVDNFKFINDSYGHIVGDQLLLEVGKRLREINNDNIMSFRLGGDEFIVLIENIVDKNDVEYLLKYLHKVVSNPFFVNGHMFYITCSGGVVVYPENGSTYQELLKNADTAMYKSKELGKGINSFYHEKMGETAIEKAKISGDLYRAIENNEFELYYQPIIDIERRKITGCEALIRWMHPENGIISPVKFINIAEENGTIIKIGKWVFENACEYAKAMHNSGHTDFNVSVNISLYQLLEKDFTNYVFDTIKRIGIAPESIIIEITESVLIQSMELAINKIKVLKDKNIRIALDDFGCGYSSLTYLKMLPINIVKIDRSFISDIECEEDIKNMTNIIILLARQLGLRVIAEGVENKHQLNYLKKHGCDMFQGYIISKPLPSQEFTKLIKNASLTCI